MSGSEFSHLANRTRHGVLVTLSAGLRIVNRAETLGDIVTLLESRPVSVHRGLRNERVGLIIEARGGFGGRLALDSAAIEGHWEEEGQGKKDQNHKFQ